jgi:hypothetical protein
MMFEVYDELTIPDLMGKGRCRAKKSHSDRLHESLKLDLFLRFSGTVKEGVSNFVSQAPVSSSISDL